MLLRWFGSSLIRALGLYPSVQVGSHASGHLTLASYPRLPHLRDVLQVLAIEPVEVARLIRADRRVVPVVAEGGGSEVVAHVVGEVVGVPAGPVWATLLERERKEGEIERERERGGKRETETETECMSIDQHNQEP